MLEIIKPIQFTKKLAENVPLTDSTHAIYQPTNISTQAANSWKKNLSLCVSTKYFPILTMLVYLDTSTM